MKTITKKNAMLKCYERLYITRIPVYKNIQVISLELMKKQAISNYVGLLQSMVSVNRTGHMRGNW